MFEWIIFALIGIFAGLSSGLLGLGGGAIIVPALLMVFSWQGLFESHLMHMAVVTSLMTIVITSIPSAYSHHKQGHVDWQLVKTLMPGLMLGGVLGAVLASRLSSQFLQQFFAMYLFFAAIKMWVPNTLAIHQQLLNKSVLISFGSIVGVISALVGVGGGTFIVPYLVMANQPIPRAIGTSATCGLPIAIAALIGFLVIDIRQELDVMKQHTELIHWPAFLGIISTSPLFAIVGVKIVKKVPVVLLKRLFSIVLLIVATYLAVNLA